MIDGWVVAVIFVATVIRSAFGFGEALIAVPLLVFVMPVHIATPLAVLVSITVAAIVTVQDWHRIHLDSAWRLVVSTLFGIPLGILLLIYVADQIVKAILATVIIAFSLYCLLRRNPAELKNDRLAWLFGFAAGVLGGAYGVNGPPLVIYGVLRRWSPERFRATLQGYFLPASLVAMGGYWIADKQWVPEVTRLFLISLVPAVAATFLGRVINRRLRGHAFLIYIHVGLIAIATMLLIQATCFG